VVDGASEREHTRTETLLREEEHGRWSDVASRGMLCVRSARTLVHRTEVLIKLRTVQWQTTKQDGGATVTS